MLPAAKVVGGPLLIAQALRETIVKTTSASGKTSIFTCPQSFSAGQTQ
jgi:hypothetical protein